MCKQTIATELFKNRSKNSPCYKGKLEELTILYIHCL